MIKILLVEVQDVVRLGIRTLLEKEKDLQVIGEATNGRDALEFLQRKGQPDILITAINLSHLSGLGLLMRVSEVFPAVKVIMLTGNNDDKYIIEAFKTGAKGYMLKSVSAIELIFGIRHIHVPNERFVCNELAIKLLDKFLYTFDFTGVDIKTIDFSKREIEVLSLVSEGLTNQEIADRLFTSKRTIESHRQNLLDKTGVRNTAALMRYAFTNSLLLPQAG